MKRPPFRRRSGATWRWPACGGSHGSGRPRTSWDRLDDWQGNTYLSVVAFLFWTRECSACRSRSIATSKGEPPLLRSTRTAEGRRRAVVFVKELVPRAAIAWVARALYNENYSAVPMGHELRRSADGSQRIESVSYRWRAADRQNRLFLSVASGPRPALSGSLEEFIAEHYWGYSVQRDGGTCESRVEHSPWRVAPAAHVELDCDVRRVYGDKFGTFLQGQPVSAFLADGSDVTVSHGGRLVG